MKVLEGKTALITGASKGIGRAIAQKFADLGANVAFTYLSSVEKGQALENELSQGGAKVKGFRSDASDFKQAEELVENVVKHNVKSKNMPLVIDIFTVAGNKLVVNNNLQRRTVKAPSNKVGLENIRAKYALLKQPGFQVMEDKNNFTVVLPLIWNKSMEGKQLIKHAI